jgi:type I restriction enzyme S subunit
MDNKTKKKNPEIRFKGFTEDWNFERLENLASFSKGRGYSKGDLLDAGIPIILYGRLYTKYQAYINEVDTFVFPKEGSVYSNGNEVIVPASGETPEDIVRASAVLKKDILLGGDLNIVIPNDSINSIFLALNISSGKIKKDLVKRAQGKSVVHLRNNDLKEVFLNYPNIREQNAITSFFQNLDNLITLHQKKYDKLIILKKAMLVKMFPKNGAVMPEIRFKGFSEDWAAKKLSEITKYYNGKSHESQQGKSGKYELINLNSISINGGLKPSGKFINEADTTLNENDLVMILSDVGYGDLLGRVAVIPANNKFVLNQRVALLRPDNTINSIFLLYNINNNQRYFKMQGAGMSQLNLSKSSVEDFTSYIPCIDEQLKIGLYFQNLDSQIALYQTQLKKLNNIKKACFNKMFVAQD